MLGTVIGVGRLLLDTAKMVFPDNKEIGAAAHTADKVNNTYNLLTQHSVTQSFNRTLVSPIIGIDKTILHATYMGTVLQVVTLRDIQAVLSHIAIKNAESMGVKIDEVIGGVQPRRAGLVSLQGCEAVTLSGPNPTVTEEKDNDDIVKVNGKTYDSLSEYVPLAVGKVVMVTVNGPQGGKVDIPLTFRESPMPMSPQQLINTFSAAKAEDGFFARLSMWNAGEISGPEFFSASDVTKEKFRQRNEDMTGYFEEMDKRDRINKVNAIRTGVMSMNTMANTFIMSTDTLKQLELSIGRRLTNSRSLPLIFKAVKASRIVICDERNGVFLFATNGDDLVETFTLRELEVKAKKGDSADSLEQLARILAGK